MSEISSEKASRALESLGWRTVDLPPKTRGPLDGVFESLFAIAAIVLGESTFRAEGGWRRCQTAFADVVGGGDLSREKDRYLVFVVEEVSEEDVPELEAALADTHFARKMCIETRGASLEDTFGDSVILAGPRIVAEAGSATEEPLLPEAILEDLAKKGAGRILDRLLAGKYGGGE